MTAEQVRHQFRVGPCQMCPETRSVLDPHQRRSVADGFPLNGPTVFKPQNLGWRVTPPKTPNQATAAP
jgi:hypothetical protein